MKIVFALIFALLVSSMVGMQSAKSNFSTLTVPNDFPTIQTAIDNAFAGQTIFVKAGIYHEQYILSETQNAGLIDNHCII